MTITYAWAHVDGYSGLRQRFLLHAGGGRPALQVLFERDAWESIESERTKFGHVRLWRAFRPNRPWQKQCSATLIVLSRIWCSCAAFNSRNAALFWQRFLPDELADKVRDRLGREAAA
jgi:hypothetical protein